MMAVWIQILRFEKIIAFSFVNRLTDEAERQYGLTG
jgi:hypothetical protein